MATNFSRAVGAKADVSELEYVSALLQTSANIRSNGVVSSLDIARFLKSRHALAITHPQAKDIVRALGGGSTCHEVRMNVAASVAAKMRSEAQKAKRISHRERWRTLQRSVNRSHHEASKELSVVDKDSSLSAANPGETAMGFPTEEQIDRTKLLIQEILSPTVVYLDIVQLTSILLIPTIARMAKQCEAALPHPDLTGNRQPPSDPVDTNAADRPADVGEVAQNYETTEESYLPIPSTQEVFGFVTTLLGQGNCAADADADDADEDKKDEQEEAKVPPVPIELDLHDEQNPNDNHQDPKKVSVNDSLVPHADGNEQPMQHNMYTEESKSNQQKTIFQGESLEPQPPGLIQLVLHTMWAIIRDASTSHDMATALGGPPLLTPDAMRALLLENGEMERVNDPALIQRMMDVAQSPDNPGRLDERAFLRALTADLQDWEVGSEDRQSTYVYDVFGHSTMESFDRLGMDSSYRPTDTNAHNPTQGSEPSNLNNDLSIPKEASNNSNTKTNDDGNSAVPSDSTFQWHPPADPINGNHAEVDKSIQGDGKAAAADHIELNKKNSVHLMDTVVDSYGSTTSLLLAWMAYIGQTASYASLMLQMDAFQFQCDSESFKCTLGITVVSWIVAALLLTLFGFVVLVPLSYGNHPTHREPRRMFIAAVIASALTVTPLLVLIYFSREEYTHFNQEVLLVINSDRFAAMIYLCTIIGSILVGNYFCHFAIGIARQFGYTPQQGGWVELFSTTSHLLGTARTKRAATRKINKLLSNARDLHGSTEELAMSPGSTMSFHKSQSDTVFQNYTLNGEKYEDAGSLLWVWERIITGELFDNEGVWLPSRLIIFQFGQIAVALMTLFLLFFFVGKVSKAADDAQSNINEGLPSWFYEFVPTGQQVRWALVPAASISVAVCVFLILLYIPSTVKTILKYRCGEIPALLDRTFQIARKGPDTAYMNTANAIYGMLAAAVLFFLLIGLVLFLFLWEFTRSIVLLILAWGIGLTITILAKSIMTSFCRKRFFRAFYRIYPGRANITTLALECWFIGLGGGVLIGRITQFLLASAFWIGRIDEPFLAENVALLGYKFDYVPLNYVKELLVHEAHRHPYIERIGAMYLMRLRHKSFASSDACACWRQLFVLTLLPWLMKYRVFEEQRGLESLRDQESEREVKADEDREVISEMAGEILGKTVNLVAIVDHGAKAVGQVGLDAVDAGTQLFHQV